MIIYKTTNLINNKCYVGKDKYNNPKYIGSGKFLKYAINKYGKQNFKKEIIQICSSLEELNEREIYWIKELNTKVPNGYNLTDGGEGLLNPSEEVRKNISIGLKNSEKFQRTMKSNSFQTKNE
jgi:group I intron endonuclease